jgi:hypothetical protein
MDNRKYIGMDVHQASISIAVSDDAGKVLMESIIETKAGTVLEFIQGLRGSLSVTFEEGTPTASQRCLGQRRAVLGERAPQAVARLPLPRHRAYGSVHGDSSRLTKPAAPN